MKEMMRSKNEMFEISVYRQNEEFPYFKSPEKIKYLIVEPGEAFQIKMISVDKTIVYGAKLFIDNFEVIHLKTFKKHGHFYGSKQGNGVYKEFRFTVPISEEEINQNNSIYSDYSDNKFVKKNPDEIGSVRINFYATKRVNSRKREKHLRRFVEVVPSIKRDDKKFFMNSMTVQDGDAFQIKNTYRDYLDSQTGDLLIENVMDESKIIDECTFRYADFIALQLMGVISLNNIKHLQYIPYKVKLEINLAISALQTIILNNKNNLHLQELEDKFLNICRHPLNIYYDDNTKTVEDFIIRHFLKFRLNTDNTVTVPYKPEKKDEVSLGTKGYLYLLNDEEKSFYETRNKSKNQGLFDIVETINLIDDDNDDVVELEDHFGNISVEDPNYIDITRNFDDNILNEFNKSMLSNINEPISIIQVNEQKEDELNEFEQQISNLLEKEI